MKKGAKNGLASRILALVLVCPLLCSNLPANATTVEEKAAEDITVSENPLEEIYLPITFKDARRDGLFFDRLMPSTNYPVEPSVHDPDDEIKYVESMLSADSTPVYNDAAIRNLAANMKVWFEHEGKLAGGLNTEADSNVMTSNLYQALLDRQAQIRAYGDMPDTWTFDYDETTENSTGFAQYGNFSHIWNFYDAAEWLLTQVFSSTNDGTYQNYGDGQPFMINVYDYDFLKLKKVTGVDYRGHTEYYTYSSVNYNDPEEDLNAAGNKVEAYTAFDKTTGIIQNVSDSTEGESRGLLAGGGWYPLTGLGFQDYYGRFGDNNVNEEKAKQMNTAFVTKGRGTFAYHKDQDLFFGFLGDDDVFLYINGKLVIEMEGLYDEVPAYVALESQVTSTENIRTTKPDDAVAGQTWAQYLGLEEGKIYDFHFFHVERQHWGSTFQLFTNMKVSSVTPEKKAYDNNGNELPYGSYVEENADVTYGFELINSTDGLITDLEFTDSKLGVILTKDSVDISANTGSYGTQISDLEWAIFEKGTQPVYQPLSGDTDAEKTAALKSLLEAGIEKNKVFAIKGFKYNVGTAEVIDNVLYTSAIGNVNNGNPEKVKIPGKDTMQLKTVPLSNVHFVLDYAKPMSMTKNQIFPNNEIGAVNAKLELEDKKINETIIALDNADSDNANKSAGVYGNIVLNSSASGETDYLTYTLNRFMNGTDTFTLNVPVGNSLGTETAAERYNLHKNVTVLPANNVYYEDDFMIVDENGNQNTDPTIGIVYSGDWTEIDIDANGADDTIDSTNTKPNDITADPTGSAPDDKNTVHGWEDALADDTNFSGGSAHKTEIKVDANGTATNSATAQFTFTGTGVDIYSRTNMKTGTVYAKLRGTEAESGKTVAKGLIVDNLAASNGTDGYYQIPTLWFNNLEYGTYNVQLYVTTAAASEARFTYYLDGIRVYNPIQNQENDAIVSEAYGSENEQQACFTSIRDILLDANSFTSGATESSDGTTETAITGAVFIDQIRTGEGTEGDFTTTTQLGVYTDYGPKNEVYLAPGQSIAFKVDPALAEAHYYIGLKSPTGSTVKTEVTHADGKKGIVIDAASDMYYEVVPDKDGYIVISNITASGADLQNRLLSVTKLRTTANGGENGIVTITAQNAKAAVLSLRDRSEVADESTEDGTTTPDTETPEINQGGNVEIENPSGGVQMEEILNMLKALLNLLFNGFEGWF